MNLLCFAFLLSQNPKEDLAPPLHIQDLIKNRILHQLKHDDLDLKIYFDNTQCETIGTYSYLDNAVKLSSLDEKAKAHLEYSHILEGKSLDLNFIKKLIENKKNIAALTVSKGQEELPQKKNWLPWVLGSAAIGLGGILLYQSRAEREQSTQKIRRYR
ncbi:MAG: hypothetical protein WCK43_00255 [bacterium]